MSPYEEMLEVVRIARREEIPYAICGGLALTVHGFVRATKDIDLLILPEDVRRMKQAAMAAGFTLEAAPMTFGARTERETRIHRVSKPMGEDLFMLDLIEVGANLKSVWAGRETVRTAEGDLTVVSREGLRVMKQRAGRAQDLVDIQRLEEMPDA